MGVFSTKFQFHIFVNWSIFMEDLTIYRRQMWQLPLLGQQFGTSAHLFPRFSRNCGTAEQPVKSALIGPLIQQSKQALFIGFLLFRQRCISRPIVSIIELIQWSIVEKKNRWKYVTIDYFRLNVVTHFDSGLFWMSLC